MAPRTLSVPSGAPTRLDSLLARALPGHTREAIRALLEQGLVRVNGRQARVHRRLHGGETVELTLPAPRRLATVSGPPLRVLLDREDFLIIDKPPGHPVEPERGQVSIVELAATQLGAFDVGGLAAPGVPHRLDKDTTGCLLLARTDAALVRLHAAFEAKGVDKRYLALVLGAPPDEGRLDTPYGRDPQDPRRYTTRVSSARRARLGFQVRERFPEGLALLEVHLETGRTHQIRAQLADLGFPLLGDPVYGQGPSPLLARVALHAVRLGVAGPGSPVEAHAPIPDDLAQALQALRRGGAAVR
jgi:23S rRNA pseudouridine1911/1915/1917 synthase